MCELAVEEDGQNLEFVPDEMKTLEMCIMAVNDCHWAIEFVPEEIQDEVSGLDIPEKAKGR